MDLLQPVEGDADAVLEAFVGWVEGTGLALYPAQEEALLALAAGDSVVLATPTGSGKSLVATGALHAALSAGRRSWYTAPIKALVSEKFFALVEVLGPDQVGMMTGDASVNPDAPVVVCTAEVLANLALREGADVDLVVMDEFHYYADPDRGWAWQVPLLTLPDAQFLLMSATLGDTAFFRDDLRRRTGRDVVEVAHAERPVPLTYEYVVTPLHETVEDLLQTSRVPAYVVHPTQAGAVEHAQALMSTNLSTRADKDRIAEQLGAFRFSTGFGTTLSRLVRHGIGVHHAGMLPKYRRLVEQLAQAGLLKVVCGTDTLGVGINVPIRTVVLTSLAKYDGRRQRLLKARELHQLAGRAGRAGYDTSGHVVAQAPEHVVENERALAKAGDDPKKRRKVVRKKPPEGFVSWSDQTFAKLVDAPPEPLQSSFRVSTAMLLNVLAGPGDPVERMRSLLLDNHEPAARRRRHVKRALELYRALRRAGVVERVDGRIRLTVDLPPFFALNQPLSPYALAVLQLLDPASPSYALDVLTVLESTLDDPRQVLQAQLHKARGEAVAAMKADGVEYEERLELLEDVSWPRPLAAELLEPAYETYRAGHPWIADFPLRPKSVARDLSERSMTFNEYVSYYGLARSEGLVLRYLADAYKALRQTVPPDARTPDVEDLTEWLGELVRQTDSSLLDEWEALRAPGAPAVPVEAPPVTRNERAFRVLVRNALFRRVELFALRRWDLLGELDPDVDWAAAGAAYAEDHDAVGTGPDARGPELFSFDGERVRQVLDDPAGDRDWAITAVVDREASDEAGVALLRDVAVTRLD